MSALDLRILIYWTLVATSGDTVACELCRTPNGLEVRCLSHATAPIRRAPVASALEASALAAAWKEMSSRASGPRSTSTTSRLTWRRPRVLAPSSSSA